MKSYRTLALKELLSQKVTSILIMIAVVLSTMMTTIVGQSIGVLSAMREQQAIAIGGNRYATFLQMNADQLHALEQDERLSYVGKSIYMGSLWIPLIIVPNPATSSPPTRISRKSAIQAHYLHAK